MNAEAVKKTNWWSRNWKWSVPVIALTAIIIIGLAVFGFFYGIMSAMKSLEPYQAAVKTAQENEEVIRLFGGKIEPKWYVEGSFKSSSQSGYASFNIPVFAGSKTGYIYIDSVKEAGAWRIRELFVELDETGQSVTLVEYNEK